MRVQFFSPVVRALGSLLGLGAALSLAGCTIALGNDAHQCESDQDCAALGAGFEGTFCNADYVCQSSLEYCSTNEQCIERNQSETFICRQSDNRCVNLLTAQCPKLLADAGDLRNQDTIVLGHLGFPSTALPLLAGENALDMARQEFRDVTGGAPGGRPVAVVSCDISPFSEADHQTATDHLIDEVGVPLIFGPILPDWMVYTLPKAVEKGVSIITAGSNVSYDSNPERVGVLFRNNFWQAALPTAQAQLIEDYVEPKIRTDLGLMPTDQIRLAVIYTDEGIWKSTLEDLFDLVRFNGKTAIENGVNYKQFTYGSIDDPDYDAKLAQVVVDSAAFQPHVMVYLGGFETADAYIELEQLFPDTTHHLLPGAAGEQKVIDFIGTNESRRSRFYVMQGGQLSVEPSYAQFLLQYEAKFPDGGEGLIAGAIGAPQYDAFYHAMYAIAANGSAPLTGTNLGQMMFDRLGSGVSIEMGPTHIQSAFQRLQVGESIVYEGAYTRSVYNPSGDVVPRVLVICVSPDTALANRFVESGLYYDPEMPELLGTNSCY